MPIWRRQKPDPRREFIRYVEIALREARESLYWLRICEALQLGPEKRVRELRGEADQLVRILTAIVVNTKRRSIIGLLLTVTCIMSWASFVSQASKLLRIYADVRITPDSV